jgi:hypothetical protein
MGKAKPIMFQAKPYRDACAFAASIPLIRHTDSVALSRYALGNKCPRHIPRREARLSSSCSLQMIGKHSVPTRREMLTAGFALLAVAALENVMILSSHASTLSEQTSETARALLLSENQVAGDPQMRTVLDETFELIQQSRSSQLGKKAERLRQGFSATREGAQQLDDLEKMLFEEKRYKDARTFVRLFNNFEQRSIMQKLNKLLPEEGNIRKRAERLSDELVEALKRLDKAAKKEDEQAARSELNQCRDLIHSYLGLEQEAVQALGS